jgi:hypothetical protein
MNPVGLPERVVCRHCGMALVFAINKDFSGDISKWTARHEITGYCPNDNRTYLIPTIECKPVEE